jgi:hypothetical protein
MTDTIPYEVTGKAGEAEFRLYPPVILATVEDDGDGSGFRLLFAYITGSNRPRNTISMTAPVITSERIPMTAPVITSEQIPMTAPVITSPQIPMTAPVISGPGTMSFVMPPGRTLDEIPEPTDDKVRIEEVRAREVAVIRFSGHAHEDDVKKVAVRLFEELRNAGVATRGTPFLMRYNAPYTPGFLRRNEVGIEIQR